MCIFDQQIDDCTLEKLQGFEFAVSSYMLLGLFITTKINLSEQFSEDGDEKKFFYHTAKTRELDNLLGDIYHKILGIF